jgi:hypothetical protein
MLWGNPYFISFPEKTEISNEDYVTIQEELRKVNIEPLLEALYPKSQGFADFGDFLSRCSRGLRQTLIDEERGLLPLAKFEKINKGGPWCIVTSIPQNEKYINFAEAIPNALRESSFDGYYLCYFGKWPNPNGREIKYVGVPYSFKVFMVLEAYKLGFDQVLWIDSALLPLKNPDFIFREIEEKGGFLTGWCAHSALWRYILPSTRDLLYDLTGVDVLNTFYICTRVFGLNMKREETWRFIREYERFTKLGTPFLSCYPEEFVFTAILGNSEYQSWARYFGYQIFQDEQDVKSLESKINDLFFLQRVH